MGKHFTLFLRIVNKPDNAAAATIEMDLRSGWLTIFEIAAHILGWLLALLALNSLLALRTEEVLVVNGVEQMIVYTRSLLPYILVSLAVKAVLVYGCALWIFPAYFKRKKIAAGLTLVLLLLGAVVLMEYGGYAWVNANDGVPGISPVQTIDYRPLEGRSENLQIQENQFSFWNLSLYTLGFALAIAWFFARDWNRQQKQLRELQQLQTDAEPNRLKTSTFGYSEKKVNGAVKDFQVTTHSGAATPDETFISLKSGTYTHRVKTGDILFLKKEGNYFTVFTSDKKIVIRQNMESALQSLPRGLFCRVHRSFIVSLRHITVVGKHSVKVGEYAIPVSESYREMLLKHT